MKLFDVVIFLFSIIIQRHLFVLCDSFTECIGVTTLTFVASKEDCRKYIFCDGDDSYAGECDIGDYFNAIYQTCDPAEIVMCRLEQTESQLDTTISIQEQLKTTTTTSFTTTTTSQRPMTTTAKPTTTTTTTTTTVSNSPSTSLSSLEVLTTAGFCPTLEDPNRMLMLKNPNACDQYYICYQGLTILMHCTANLHFNDMTGKCDYPQRALCQVNFSQPNTRQQCQAFTYDFFPHETNCNYFYQCKLGYLLLHQCPQGYGWDYERRLCTTIQQAKCFNKK